VSGTHPLRRIRQCRFVTVSFVCSNETMVSNECHFFRGISFVFTNCQQWSVIWVGRSPVLWPCGHCGLRRSAYARSSTRFPTRIVCDHCNFGETRLLWWGSDIVDRINVVHIHRPRRLLGVSAGADVDAARSSFATLSPAPCSLGAAQWPLILSGILSSFFQHPNLISFYIFYLQMLRHFEVRSKLLSLFHFCAVLRLWVHCCCTSVLQNSLLRIIWKVTHASALPESWVMTAAMARNSVIFASRAYACWRRLKSKIARSRSKHDAYVYGLSLDTVAMCLQTIAHVAVGIWSILLSLRSISRNDPHTACEQRCIYVATSP
jgi:hypothetical protein